MLNPTVYIIDDDSHICRAVSRLLRLYNYSVHSYSSASQFLCHKHPSGPACLLLDLKMPEIDGLDVQEILARENKQVGFELGTAESTVKAQRARVMQELGAGSLPDIVRLVERLRLAGAIPAVSERAHT
jgi:FixJ family two-component response regulator